MSDPLPFPLSFDVTFHAPFLSATGRAADGFDASVDPRDPIRESTLKGAMSAAAESILGFGPAYRQRLFGSVAQPARWRWLIKRGDPVKVATRHRVAIDDETHTSQQDMLLRARVGLLPRLTFEVTPWGSWDPEEMREEAIALTAAARAVHRLGGQASRGMGWVGITGGIELDADAQAALGRWRGEEAAS